MLNLAPTPEALNAPAPGLVWEPTELLITTIAGRRMPQKKWLLGKHLIESPNKLIHIGQISTYKSQRTHQRSWDWGLAGASFGALLTSRCTSLQMAPEADAPHQGARDPGITED